MKKIQKCLENEKETIQLTLLDQILIQIDLIYSYASGCQAQRRRRQAARRQRRTTPTTTTPTRSRR